MATIMKLEDLIKNREHPPKDKKKPIEILFCLGSDFGIWEWNPVEISSIILMERSIYITSVHNKMDRFEIVLSSGENFVCFGYWNDGVLDE